MGANNRLVAFIGLREMIGIHQLNPDLYKSGMENAN